MEAACGACPSAAPNSFSGPSDPIVTCAAGYQARPTGSKNAKKRAVVAVARKLAVLLHRLWVTGEVYDPFYHSLPDQTSVTQTNLLVSQPEAVCA